MSSGYQHLEESVGRCTQPAAKDPAPRDRTAGIASPGDRVERPGSLEGKGLEHDAPQQFGAQVTALRVIVPISPPSATCVK